MNLNTLSEKIAEAEFHCLLCGDCCSGEDNEVAVSPPEIEVLIKLSGFSFEETVEPYPVWLNFPDGRKYTFGWILCRGKDGNCIFLKSAKCQVYENRPHLCRTYPFMLDGGKLIISECPGLYSGKKTFEPEKIAADLLRRQEFEEAEFCKTKEEYQKHCNTSASTLVFDSKGVHQWKIR